ADVVYYLAYFCICRLQRRSRLLDGNFFAHAADFHNEIGFALSPDLQNDPLSELHFEPWKFRFERVFHRWATLRLNNCHRCRSLPAALALSLGSLELA